MTQSDAFELGAHVPNATQSEDELCVYILGRRLALTDELSFVPNFCVLVLFPYNAQNPQSDAFSCILYRIWCGLFTKIWLIVRLNFD